MPAPNLRQINVSLPTELASLVDVATPTHRSRSVVTVCHVYDAPVGMSYTIN